MIELRSVAKCESNVVGIDRGEQEVSGVHPNGDENLSESDSSNRRDPQRILGRKLCCDVLSFPLIIPMLGLFLTSKVSATELQKEASNTMTKRQAHGFNPHLLPALPRYPPQ